MTNEPSPQKPTVIHPWEKYLPSKKIKIVIIIILVIAVLYAIKNPMIHLFKKTFQKTTETLVTVPIPLTEQPKISLSTDKDTDGDGLADWQETLIGTDPLTPNSPEEIPQSVRDLVNTASNSVISTEDKLALKVYNRLETDPKGTNILEAVQAATAKEVLDLANSLDTGSTTYSVEDVNLIDDVDFNETNYINTLKKIKTSITPSKELQEKIYTLLTTGKSDIAITTYQLKLRENLNTLLTTPVSVRQSEPHVIIINAVSHMNDMLAKNYTSVDPSVLYASLLVYQKNKNLFDQLTSL